MDTTKITNTVLSMFFASSLSSIGLAAEKNEIDLLRAISISIESTGGGKALEAKREHEDGKLVFEVEVLKDSKLTEISVDAATGKIVESSTENFFSKLFNMGEREEREIISKSKISLEQAIEIALKSKDGEAIEAETKYKNKSGFIEVTILSGTTETELQISPDDGTIIKSKTENDDEQDHQISDGDDDENEDNDD